MNTITELSRTINMLMAHPDNEPNSEFADRIDSLIDLKEQLTLTDVVKPLNDEGQATLTEYATELINMQENPQDSNKDWKIVVMQNTIVKLHETIKSL
jgi:hypothetical protein